MYKYNTTVAQITDGRDNTEAMLANAGSGADTTQGSADLVGQTWQGPPRSKSGDKIGRRSSCWMVLHGRIGSFDWWTNQGETQFQLATSVFMAKNIHSDGDFSVGSISTNVGEINSSIWRSMVVMTCKFQVALSCAHSAGETAYTKLKHSGYWWNPARQVLSKCVVSS